MTDLQLTERVKALLSNPRVRPKCRDLLTLLAMGLLDGNEVLSVEDLSSRLFPHLKDSEQRRQYTRNLVRDARSVMQKVRSGLSIAATKTPKGRSRTGYTLILVETNPSFTSPMNLRTFLCHSSADKPRVRELYSQLRDEGFNAWLDEADLLPGQDWEAQIRRAVRDSDIVLVCISSSSVNKQGFVQKEIRIALDAADEKPEGTIYIIPARLEECQVPERLRKWHWVNLYDKGGFERLIASLALVAKEKGAGPS